MWKDEWKWFEITESNWLHRGGVILRFEYWTTPGQTHIKAILEEEDHFIGNRQEGIGTQIELQNTTLTYEYEVKEIHPDILGLICMINFYPFIGKRVAFPNPVSPSTMQGRSVTLAICLAR